MFINLEYRTPKEKIFLPRTLTLKHMWKYISRIENIRTTCSVERIVQTVGRRKTAVANVTITNNSNLFQVNGYPVEKFFIENASKLCMVKRPFCVLSYLDMGALSSIKGGGTNCQISALQIALARAITTAFPHSRKFFREHGFLTCISRKKERRKYGLKKARKASQFSKR